MLSGIPNADFVKMTAILSMDDVLIYQAKTNSSTNPIFDVKGEKWIKENVKKEHETWKSMFLQSERNSQQLKLLTANLSLARLSSLEIHLSPLYKAEQSHLHKDGICTTGVSTPYPIHPVVLQTRRGHLTEVCKSSHQWDFLAANENDCNS